jgi:hypothetical protein
MVIRCWANGSVALDRCVARPTSRACISLRGLEVADLAEKVVMIISGHLGIDPAAVVPEASLTNDLGADSFGYG